MDREFDIGEQVIRTDPNTGETECGFVVSIQPDNVFVRFLNQSKTDLRTKGNSERCPKEYVIPRWYMPYNDILLLWVKYVEGPIPKLLKSFTDLDI